MTVEQAKDELLNIKWFDIDGGPRGYDKREAIEMAIQSLDQTWTSLSECPYCNKPYIYINDEPNFCPNCGWKLLSTEKGNE